MCEYMSSSVIIQHSFMCDGMVSCKELCRLTLHKTLLDNLT
jgi:hypothetical protein